MICAGKGARVIANIWNGSLDKRNICTMLREKQTEEQKSESEKRSVKKERKQRKREGTDEAESLISVYSMWCFLMFIHGKIFHEILTAL